MDPSEMRNEVGRLAARLTELEELLTHQQRTIQDLNDVAVQQNKRLTGLETRLEQMARQVASLVDSITDEDTPEEEPPPHY